MEYRHIAHYGNAFVESGTFNFSSIDLGLHYIIGREIKCQNGCSVWPG
ncbi:MAG: hypothetical protein SH818_09125 [Saprospiraceae bacterium]|nr:hypothetical protein [Saprospiraceae bacterium]